MFSTSQDRHGFGSRAAALFLSISTLLGFLTSPSAQAATIHFVQDAVNDHTEAPLDAVSAHDWLETGVLQGTVTAPFTTGTPSLHFTHWTISTDPAAVFRDAWGRSQNPASFILLEDTTATAHYLPGTIDEDTDGVPDWFELEYYGVLDHAADADTDGDGLTLAQEQAGGTNPLMGNTARAGRVARGAHPRLSRPVPGARAPSSRPSVARTGVPGRVTSAGLSDQLIATCATASPSVRL